jgi:hypothetical protein
VEKATSSDVEGRTPQSDNAVEVEEVSQECSILVVTLAGTG